jgi:hypothetical protein
MIKKNMNLLILLDILAIKESMVINLILKCYFLLLLLLLS